MVCMVCRRCHSCAHVDAVCVNYSNLAQAFALQKNAAFAQFYTVAAAPWCDKTKTALCKTAPVICCAGWTKIMSICTSKSLSNVQSHPILIPWCVCGPEVYRHALGFFYVVAFTRTFGNTKLMHCGYNSSALFLCVVLPEFIV